MNRCQPWPSLDLATPSLHILVSQPYPLLWCSAVRVSIITPGTLTTKESWHDLDQALSPTVWAATETAKEGV